MWIRLGEFTDWSHRTEGDHRECSCHWKKIWIIYSCLVQGDQPQTEKRYSRWARAMMRKWNEITT